MTSQRVAHPARTLRYALRLELVTIAWMTVEATVAVGAGIVARSVLLTAFGIDSLIELLSGGVLYWRVAREARIASDDAAAGEEVERRAAQISGILLFALAAYVLVQASYSLLHRSAAKESAVGIALAIAAIIFMPTLAKAKLRVASEIGSRALKADAIQSLTCGYLSWILLAGLVANASLHLWWLDGVAALALVPYLVREGREAWRGEGCGHGCCSNQDG